MAGRPVVAVGPEADARIAAVTDDSPIAVSGWFLGLDRQQPCPGGPGSPAPNGVSFADCMAFSVRASKDGGATLPLHFKRDDPMSLPRWPDVTQVMRVLLQVHVHDPGCTAPECAQKAVFDKVLMYGSPLVAPPILAATMPPGGISMEQAIAAARAYDVETKLGFGELKVLLSAQAGPRAVVEDQSSGRDLTWVWVVRFASDDGARLYAVDVNFLDGSVSGSSSGEMVQSP